MSLWPWERGWQRDELAVGVSSLMMVVGDDDDEEEKEDL